LLKGIGDTIRISLTADPVNEVTAGIALLKSLGLRRQGVNIISCPTCGRTKIDLIGLTSEIEGRLSNINKDISVAVMGCVVNGPGEASHADIGIAGGDGCAVIFKDGKVLKKVSEENIVEELMAEIEKIN
jgi:(E)-4-hydroxy-3-methylbut-2-enyl-diphosphate synthase